MSVVRLLAMCLLALALSGCAGRDGGQRAVTQGGGYAASEEGLASFYADRYQGRRTASGERFDQHSLTAAHRSLPFGTQVRVTRLDNGRETLVRINDRGPFVRGRVIDLSRRAAQELDMIGSGTAPVRIAPQP
ncbi:septal ring lytic transglycosylase RlpA family protein [Halomonas sp. PA5]|nr:MULTISPECIES: septal ring lytic transglycosylase RlpA family protein [Halomonas]QJQ96952.1 septal ring lytic transglycosylase RlpA family protein [Halomonas sp. PA5]